MTFQVGHDENGQEMHTRSGVVGESYNAEGWSDVRGTVDIEEEMDAPSCGMDKVNHSG